MNKVLPRHVEFARRLAGGEAASVIYRDLYPKSRLWKDAVVHVRASELARKVAVRVKAIQCKAEDATVATILERKQALTEIIRGRLGNFVTAGADGVIPNIGPENLNSAALEMVESRCITMGEGDGKKDAVVTKVKVKDQVAAISELNKMEKVYVDGGGDRQLVIILRDAPRIGVEKPAIDVSGPKRIAGRRAK
ncbi:MAG: hypothetical protein WC497_05530 [Patescibacteria group bacterium]